jgi:type I restriction enzyme S subunit
MVPLSDVLTPSDEWTTIDPLRTYREVTVRLRGKGVDLRREVSGAEIAAKERIVARSGQFILSRIDARNGAFGLVPDSLDGAVVSTDFPTFNVNSVQLEAAFLYWMSKTPAFVELCRSASEGTTNRVRLKEDRFLAMTIPLPSSDEQRRIVARIVEVAKRISDAKFLHEEVTIQSDRLLVAMAHRQDLDEKTKLQDGWRRTRLGEVMREVEAPMPVRVEESYPNLGIYSYGRGLFPKPDISGASTSAKVLFRVSAGQFIYSRLFAFEGAYGLVSQQYDDFYVSNEYPTFRCDPRFVLPAFVSAYFKSPEVWAAVAVGSRGLGHRRQRVHPEQVLNHEAMIPPLTWQRRISDVQAKVEVLQGPQSETAAELDALLPAILDRAFRGEL